MNIAVVQRAVSRAWSAGAGVFRRGRSLADR
jgi:hypothetical protein